MEFGYLRIRIERGHRALTPQSEASQPIRSHRPGRACHIEDDRHPNAVRVGVVKLNRRRHRAAALFRHTAMQDRRRCRERMPGRYIVAGYVEFRRDLTWVWSEPLRLDTLGQN